MCVSSVYGGQKKVWDHLELELKRVMSQHVGAENRTQILCKNSKPSFQLLQVDFKAALVTTEVCSTGAQAYMPKGK